MWGGAAAPPAPRAVRQCLGVTGKQFGDQARAWKSTPFPTLLILTAYWWLVGGWVVVVAQLRVLINATHSVSKNDRMKKCFPESLAPSWPEYDVLIIWEIVIVGNDTGFLSNIVIYNLLPWEEELGWDYSLLE